MSWCGRQKQGQVVNIVLADHQQMMRDGLRALLEREPGLRVVAALPRAPLRVEAPEPAGRQPRAVLRRSG